MLLRSAMFPVTGDSGPPPRPARGYDVDAAFMSLTQHERGIHALCFGTNGAGVTEARTHTCVLPYRTDTLSSICVQRTWLGHPHGICERAGCPSSPGGTLVRIKMAMPIAPQPAGLAYASDDAPG